MSNQKHNKSHMSGDQNNSHYYVVRGNEAATDKRRSQNLSQGGSIMSQDLKQDLNEFRSGG